MTFARLTKKEIIIMKKYFTLLFLMTISSFVFGQNITLTEAKKPVQEGEIIIKTGEWSTNLESEEQVLQKFRDCINKEYPNRKVVVRNFRYRVRYKYYENIDAYVYWHNFAFVELLPAKVIKQNLNKAFDKALMNIREGSRFSIDNVTISGNLTNDINKESVKDNVIDVLLDKGYKVVAKEYLERLYQEQQVQQSGIYNENTVVQENNLSAVGYFLNIKITDESLRVQVVNVSTGEYEGNATITF